MKVTINVDCTPDEARAFLGLPDVKPLQQSMMADLEERMKSGMKSMDPESLLRLWIPGGDMKAFEELQKSFWTQMMGRAREQKD
jgi:hypothetical protein